MYELNMILPDSASNCSTILTYLFIFLQILLQKEILLMHDLTALIHQIVNNYKHNWKKNNKQTNNFLF